MSQHGISGVSVTVTYEILVQKCNIYREALERIASPSWAFDEAAKIARAAISASARLSATETNLTNPPTKTT